MTEDQIREADVARWEESYRHLPSGATEDEIGNTNTNDLKAAHGLMHSSTLKPPELSIPWLEIVEDDHSMSIVFARVKTFVLHESLRYSRVCRELSERAKAEDPNAALELLESALLPASSTLAFETHELYMTWMKKMEATCEETTQRLRDLAGQTVSAVPSKRPSENQMTLAVNLLAELAVREGMFNAALRISQLAESWNFRLKASMFSIAEGAKLRQRARDLKSECLEILSLDDELLAEVFNPFIHNYRPVVPTVHEARPPAEKQLEVELSQLLDSKLGPLLASLEEGVKITRSVHDRLDIVVEKLIDLDQRSKLTWSQVRKLAHTEPNYAELRKTTELALEKHLGNAWRGLTAESRNDLIDSAYIYEQASRWGSGWRMAVLGYCTTVERELRITYQAVRNRLIHTADTGTMSIKTLGDIIEALDRFLSMIANRSLDPSLRALADSTDQLRRLNAIRARAAHPKEAPVTQDEAVWIRQTVVGDKARPLLEIALAARSSQKA